MVRFLVYVLGIFFAAVCFLACVPHAKGDCYSRATVRTYHAPRQFVHARAVKVVKARVVAFDVPQYYYSTSDYGSAAQQQLLADAAAFRALQMLLQASQMQQQSYAAPAAEVPQEVCQTCQQPGNGIALAQPAQPHWHQQFAGVVKQSCLQCHNNQNGVDLSNLSAVTPSQRGACYAAVKYGGMPKGHPKLSAASVRLFQLWAQSK